MEHVPNLSSFFRLPPALHISTACETTTPSHYRLSTLNYQGIYSAYLSSNARRCTFPTAVCVNNVLVNAGTNAVSTVIIAHVRVYPFRPWSLLGLHQRQNAPFASVAAAGLAAAEFGVERYLTAAARLAAAGFGVERYTLFCRNGLFETQVMWLLCAMGHMTILEIPLAEFVDWSYDAPRVVRYQNETMFEYIIVFVLVLLKRERGGQRQLGLWPASGRVPVEIVSGSQSAFECGALLRWPVLDQVLAASRRLTCAKHCRGVRWGRYRLRRQSRLTCRSVLRGLSAAVHGMWTRGEAAGLPDAGYCGTSRVAPVKWEWKQEPVSSAEDGQVTEESEEDFGNEPRGVQVTAFRRCTVVGLTTFLTAKGPCHALRSLMLC
ncbi:hypothetical protein H257_15787 [Aphanomyces astaci]|uniref:Uncharacterized protein n=1 Tax=Aphanomyces astaci TaxID=112090 RepID=W4FNF9_APHAT|nr:hypothetical protein H257_15787 [Aphanomyces astaci]ETV68208.1 hypothetical protein H257_15787 [Aphanomyces astaci]|eukprot:XP_009842293.1 hypothetical protein H257_15787 [Aphanomyces astaci]